MAPLTLTNSIIAKEAFRLLRQEGVDAVERDEPTRHVTISFNGPVPGTTLDEYSKGVLSPLMSVLANDMDRIAAASPPLQVPAGMEGYVAEEDGLAVRIISIADVQSGRHYIRADVMSYA